MSTSRLLSTVSYNTPGFIEGTLKSLVSGGVLEYAHWILHKPENEKQKEHAHILMKPARRVDTNALRREFLQDVPGERFARGVGKIESTISFADWYRYALHDVEYLREKGETRRFQYARADVKTTDALILDEDVGGVEKRPRLRALIADAVARGVSWDDLLADGLIPAGTWRYWQAVYVAMRRRSSRVSSPPGWDSAS